MSLNFLPRENYDISINVGKISVPCYSRDRMNAMYKKKGFSVIGEIGGKSAGKPKDTISIGTNEIPVHEPRIKKGILYKYGGYVAVDKDKYIAVLESRMPVIIMLTMVFTGLVAYAFALTYFI